MCSEIANRKAEFHFVREMWDLHDFGHINQGVEELNGDKVTKKRQTNDLGLFSCKLSSSTMNWRRKPWKFSFLTPCEHTHKPSNLSGLRRTRGGFIKSDSTRLKLR